MRIMPVYTSLRADSRRDTAAVSSVIRYCSTVDFYDRVFPRDDQLHAAACMSVCLSVCPFWPVQTQEPKPIKVQNSVSNLTLYAVDDVQCPRRR